MPHEQLLFLKLGCNMWISVVIQLKYSWVIVFDCLRVLRKEKNARKNNFLIFLLFDEKFPRKTNSNKIT